MLFVVVIQFIIPATPTCTSEIVLKGSRLKEFKVNLDYMYMCIRCTAIISVPTIKTRNKCDSSKTTPTCISNLVKFDITTLLHKSTQCKLHKQSTYAVIPRWEDVINISADLQCKYLKLLAGRVLTSGNTIARLLGLWTADSSHQGRQITPKIRNKASIRTEIT